MIDKTKVRRILVITLSNIGDAILTTPVIQALRENFPQAQLAVLVGPRAFGVFKNDRRVDQKIIYDKKIPWKNKLNLINRLKKDNYDLVVDLRQTALSIFLRTRYHTSIFAKPPCSLRHMKDRHLWKLKTLGLNINEAQGPSVEFSQEEQQNIVQLLNKWQIKDSQIIVAVAPGARNMTKRWEIQGYKQLIERLMAEYGVKVVIVGDEQDELLVKEILAQMKPAPFNACGKTSLGELAFLLTKCRLLVSNDSCPMHLAWAVKTPCVSIFGPTDYREYAPAGPDDIAIHKELSCSPCKQSLCPKGTRECMKKISAEEVLAACKKILLC